MRNSLIELLNKFVALTSLKLMQKLNELQIFSQNCSPVPIGNHNKVLIFNDIEKSFGSSYNTFGLNPKAFTNRRMTSDLSIGNILILEIGNKN